MPEPTLDLAVPRRILLDVDGTILIGRARIEHPRPAGPLDLGLPPTTRTVVRDVPAGAVAVDAPSPRGSGTFPAWYRPGTIRALRRAHDAGVEILWSTSWLAGHPAALDALADLLGLGFVRRPMPAELPVPPDWYAIDGSSRGYASLHWKLRAWHHHLQRGVATTIIDDQIYFPATVLFPGPGLAPGGLIRPDRRIGFAPADAAKLTRWIRHGILPTTRRTW